MLPGLTEGRIVHYVLSEFDLSSDHKYAAGRHRPAIIVNVWAGRDDGYSNLLVFLDGSNDDEVYDFSKGVLGGPPKPGFVKPKFILWATSRIMSEGKEPGTWHWPEKN